MTDSARDMAIGRLGGQLEIIIKNNEDAVLSRKNMHEKIESIGSDIHTLKNDLKSLSERVGEMEPSVADYNTKQRQVQGAGILGRWLWWFGGIILSAAAGVVAMWTYLTGRPPP